MRKAVVDVGSNSVLLLVAELKDAHWMPLLETSEVTALGEETKETGLLGQNGIQRTLGALQRAFAAARDAGAEDVLAAATMAARIARNTDQFLGLAAEQGTPVQVLSGDQEAELGFLAVAEDPLYNSLASFAIVDVGGQSTEIVVGSKSRALFRHSFAVGTLALRSGSLSQESPNEMARFQAAHELDDLLGDLPTEMDGVVALGATGTNLVTIREAMTEWDPEKVHGSHLSYEEISRAVGWLSSLTDAERAAIPGIERGRERTIHIGALILERALYALRQEGCSVSVKGWRHALLQHPEFLQPAKA
jgi:exopolyphosphatase/guanosine-5'-triphosphate,3'-diphosphate pyrophosphatase